jgi:hypothetical protein
MVLSSHLPPASSGLLDLMLGSLAAVRDADPFDAPDQQMLEARRWPVDVIWLDA